MFSLKNNSKIFLIFLGMVAVVVLSNFLVLIPFTPLGLQDILTWGALSYPIAFLLNDVANRFYGYATAKRLLLVGFLAGIVISPFVSTWRIACASLTAFLIAQMIDANIFNRLRTYTQWWFPPMISSLIASVIDTVLFFSMAFAGEDIPWISWMVGDFLVKETVILLSLFPYGMLVVLARKQTSGVIDKQAHS